MSAIRVMPLPNSATDSVAAPRLRLSNQPNPGLDFLSALAASPGDGYNGRALSQQNPNFCFFAENEDLTIAAGSDRIAGGMG
jgi:hypothetical protein